MQLPSAADYKVAIQQPQIAFGQDVDLRSCQVQRNAQRQPFVRSGNFAYTYQLIGRGQSWAVRCFSKYLPKSERYQAIERFFQSHPQPFLVTPRFLERGIVVRGQWYPVIKMPWIDGETLGVYLDNHVNDRLGTANLSRSFESLVFAMGKLGMAHGDLQHGNIMVNKGKLVLVDYDSTYVPGLRLLDVEERGHHNYQHPARNKEFGPAVDRFSSIAISLALRALTAAPELWAKYADGESLLFHQTDYRYPDKSQVFADLEQILDMAPLIRLFRRVCQSDLATVPSLADFLAQRVAVDVPTRAVAAERWDIYKTVAAYDREGLLRAVGDRVTVIGQITGFAPKTTDQGKPYGFVDFGNWRQASFRLVVWSEGLEAFQRQNRDLGSYRGKWVSVTGLLDEYQDNVGRRPQIVIETPAEIEILSGEEEARNRLTGQATRPATPRTLTTKSTTAAVSQQNKTAKADHYLNQGISLHRSGQIDSAANYYRTALQLNPGLAVAHFNIGLIHEQQGNESNAVAAYEAAIQARPGFPEAYARLGWLWVDKGRYDKSKQYFEAALKSNARDGEAYFGLAYSLSQQGRHNEALSAYESAVAYEPNPAALLGLAETYQNLEMLDEAERACSRAVQLDSGNQYAKDLLQHIRQTMIRQKDGAVLTLTATYQRSGQWTNAEQILKNGLRRRPEWPEARAMLAQTYAAMDRMVEAYREAQHAARLGSQEGQSLLRKWQPRLALSPPSLDFGDILSGNTSQRMVTVRNTGSGVLEGQVVVQLPWLSVSSSTFELGPDQAQEVKVVLSKDAPPKVHKVAGALYIHSNAGNQTLPVSASVKGPEMALDTHQLNIMLDPDGRGEGTASVTNVGGGVLEAVLTASNGQHPYVRVEPRGIVCKAGETVSFTIRVLGRPTASESVPEGTVVLQADCGSATVEWKARYSGPRMRVIRSQIDFGTFTRGDPPSDTFLLTNLGTEPVHGEALGPGWLTVEPKVFELAPDESSKILLRVIPDVVELRYPKLADLFQGEVRLESNGGNASVAVKLTSKYLAARSRRR